MTEEFKNLLEKALEPLCISTDEVDKSFATVNSNIIITNYVQKCKLVFWCKFGHLFKFFLC